MSSHEMCLGAGCLINANGAWRRAVIIDCSRSTRFDVKLIDTGAYDEVQDSVSLFGHITKVFTQILLIGAS